ncbi:NAD-glutamate dehydrogenase [Nocardioides sp. BP30]|uniref:NAD-glutamate dehydrogenase n=1 Tax=Nocardioides sp. BP30 TaxID=3036374 RepID=UPI00246955D8|nr:NAD-glutamate dehydrogenase [Nocardioides sp. BP30]WGL53488.1 NAD-glutamate dehydrogenase [Nocardioides sp. BP30]
MSTTTQLLDAYVRHVDREDVDSRSPADLQGALESHLDLAQTRPQGTARVRICTPSDGPGGQGWSAAGRTVVEIVVDDMPYLVDSVTMELSRQRRDVHLVIHPVFDVERDIAGELKRIEPVTDAAAQPPEGVVRESWMHVETDRVPDGEIDELVADLQRVLEDVREAVEDTGKILERVATTAASLRSETPAGIPAREAEEAAALLEWLAEGRFTFLGARDYRLEGTPGAPEFLRGLAGTGLGILRNDPPQEAEAGRMPELVRAKATERTVLVLAKANSRSTVGHPGYLDHVGIKTFDEAGEVVGERLFLGMFTSTAYTEPIGRVPVLRRKAKEVLARSGVTPESHVGQSLFDTLDTYPHDELFYAGVDELAALAATGLAARERRTLRVVARPDTYGRYLSVLVWLPRDRYTTAVRERFARILTEQYDATDIEYFVRIGQSTTARVQFVVHLSRPVEVDVPDLERRLAAAARSWRDDLAVALSSGGYDAGLRRWLDAYPAAYEEDFTAATGAADLAVLDRLGEDGIDLGVYRPERASEEEARLKIYRVGTPLSLSHVLPMLTSLGVEVTDERPYGLIGTDQPIHIYDFGLRYAGDGGLGEVADHDRFRAALQAMWDGAGEVDSFNTLVLAAGLDHREVMVLRAYARYLQQGGTPFSQRTIAGALRTNVTITRLLVELFGVRFDPELGAGTDGDRARREEELVSRIEAALDDVASLDQDRILRSYLTHITATLRTNWFVPASPERINAALSLKLEPTLLPDLPLPRPEFEIFVYAPSVEGVHLRFGPVARGGLRWSDRTDDYRTEILGLVKAQMVKNTVIVPVGAKGGFVARRPTGGVGDGPTAYRAFVRGLLDLTDNLVDGESVPPPHVVCHDGADSYLVVAADKGTATFSDLANEVAGDYGFWLGDAFASGGSVGYDHKAMGITARGAWVSVQRHFRELGVDVQSQDFTCVGIGDMSGDVFGNGMLLSPHLRLVAAFDHRDIFLDPTPDPAASFAERRRLFGLQRSSWQDYDRSLISTGGGVYSRTLKAVPISPEVRAALGLGEHVRSLTPAELVSAILRAPVDLLWNGGIGTYVKGSDEPHAAAGDKANDAVRVNGSQVRARVVGEGGNLGLTQAGRVEYALHGAGGEGGRINTDAIDNSAGVDTSDHEVNLKILLDRLVRTGEIDREERNEVLAAMTDEVAALVLRDNDQQNLALANAAANGASLLHVQEEWMAELESRGVLSREVEGLPAVGEVRRRLDAGGALTSPETAVLMSWTKIELARELIDTTLPDEEYVAPLLAAYFPSLVRERFSAAIEEHPLRREIILTQLVNELVNGAGSTFWPRLAAETGATVTELVRANLVARDLVGWTTLRERIAGLDHAVAAAVQTRMRVDLRTLVERLTRWLVAHRITDGTAAVERYEEPFGAMLTALPRLLTGSEYDAFVARRDRLTDAGVPTELAVQVAVLEPASMLLGVVEVALAAGQDPAAVVRAHLELGERLGLPKLLGCIVALPRTDRWQSMARASLRDDLHAVHAALTAQQLDGTPEDFEERLGRARSMLTEIGLDEGADLARLSVAVRALRTLL